MAETPIQPTLGNYQYSPLSSPTSFRLLEILPGSDADRLSCALHVADWDIPPQYEAISYAWGDVNDTVPLEVDNAAIQITPNLRDALHRFRRSDSSVYLWADAVCINQAAKEERSHQVKNMRQIYSKANNVLVWLGPDDEGMAEVATEAIEAAVNQVLAGASLSPASLADFDDITAVLAGSSGYLSTMTLEDARHLAPLRWYFNRTWFNRLWVFQEVNSGPIVTVICGQTQISWDFVACAAAIFSIFHPSRHLYSNLRYAWHALIMRVRRAHRELSVLQLLQIARGFQVTDPLDRVYAMLALPQFANMKTLTVDYARPKAELYLDIVLYGSQHLKNLEFLCYVQHDREIASDFPSWIPRWDQPLLAAQIAEPDTTWNASADLPSKSTAIDSRKLTFTTAGIRVDTIIAAHRLDSLDFFRQPKASDPNHYVLQFWRGATKRPDGPSLIRSLATVLVTDMDLRGRRISKQQGGTSRLKADFAAYVVELLCRTGRKPEDEEFYEGLSEVANKGDWARYEEQAGNRTRGCSIFFTDRPMIGMASNALQVGDILCVLFGCSVPVILRPRGEHFAFVGAAYVDGIMDGWVVQKWREAGEEGDEVFEIR